MRANFCQFSHSVSSSSFLYSVSSRHGVETLCNCSIVLFANSQYFFACPSMSYNHAMACAPVFLIQVTCQLLVHRFAIRTFFCVRQPNLRLAYIRVECIPSTRDERTTWVIQMSFRRNHRAFNVRHRNWPVVVDVSKYLSIQTLKVSIMLERPPF